MPHLFVDISSHGFGHLAQTAPVLRRLAALVPGLRLTVRSGLPELKLRHQIAIPFEHIAASSDFGFVMLDALAIDVDATAAAYRTAHSDFRVRIDSEARLLATLAPDAVLSNVSYLPLAAAARADIPAMTMCSLNWADLFQHHFGQRSWAKAIHEEILSAYRSAIFLRTTPGMPMAGLDNIKTVGPIASVGHDRRFELHTKLGLKPDTRVAIVAFGGIPMNLPIKNWPTQTNTHFVVPDSWQAQRKDMSAFESVAWDFTDLLRSADAVVTKPGYGTFTEAACNGTAVLYQRREDWLEQDCLIDWLHANARCVELSATDLRIGNLSAALDAVKRAPAPPIPKPDGIEQVAAAVAAMLQ